MAPRGVEIPLRLSCRQSIYSPAPFTLRRLNLGPADLPTEFRTNQVGDEAKPTELPTMSGTLFFSAEHTEWRSCTDRSAADRDFFRGGDFGNPTRTDEVWAYGRILCICELGRGRN